MRIFAAALVALLVTTLPAAAWKHGTGSALPPPVSLTPGDIAAGSTCLTSSGSGQPCTWNPSTPQNGLTTCGTPPSAIQSGQIGSGWTAPAIAAMATPPDLWATGSGLAVGVAAYSADSSLNGIASVTFWLCGKTKTVTSRTTDPISSVLDYNVNLASTSGNDGDALLYVYVDPVNGYETRLGPYHYTLNTNGTISRRVWKLWPCPPANAPCDGTGVGIHAGGVDPANSSLVVACAPYQAGAKYFNTFLWAGYCASLDTSSGQTANTGGDLVLTQSGIDLEDATTVPSGNPQNNNLRLVTLKPDTVGPSLGQFILSRTVRALLTLRVSKVEFNGVNINSGSILTLSGSVNGQYIFDGGSNVSDINGIGGPQIALDCTSPLVHLPCAGDPQSGGLSTVTSNGYFSLAQLYFTLTNNIHWYVFNANVDNYVFTGEKMLVNSVGHFSFDFSSLNPPATCGTAIVPRCSDEAGNITDISEGNNNTLFANATASQNGTFKGRYTPDNSTAQVNGSCGGTNCVGVLSVSTAALTSTPSGSCAGNTCVKITWTTTVTANAIQPNSFVEMTSGVCAGFDNKMQAVASDSTSITVPTQGNNFDGIVTVCNPTGIVAGDTGFTWLAAHADCAQLLGQQRGSIIIDAAQGRVTPNPNIKNIIYQRYSCSGDDVQQMLMQGGPPNLQDTGPSTISISGTTATSDTLTIGSVVGNTPAPGSGTGIYTAGTSLNNSTPATPFCPAAAAQCSTIHWNGSPTLYNPTGSNTGSNYIFRYELMTTSGAVHLGTTYQVAWQGPVGCTAGTCTTVVIGDATGLQAGDTLQAPLEQVVGNFFIDQANFINARIVATSGAIANGVDVSTSLEDVSATLDVNLGSRPNSKLTLIHTWDGWAMVSSYIGSPLEHGQLQDGVANILLAQDTIWGDPATATAAILWRMDVKLSIRDFTAAYDIISLNTQGHAGDPYPAQPTWHNVVLQSGAYPVTDGTNVFTVGGLTIDIATGKPTGGTLAGRTIGATPIFPTDLYGVPVNSSSLVGAAQP